MNMKGKLRKAVSVMLILAMVLSMSACGKQSGGSSDSGSASGDKIKIVVMPKVVGIDYYNAVKQQF